MAHHAKPLGAYGLMLLGALIVALSLEHSNLESIL